MLLDFVGEADAARRLEGAIQQLLTDGRVRTRDLGGDATTRQLGAALRAYLR